VADEPHDLGTPLQVEALSPRELEVLELIVGGYTNQEIAEQLCISINTVKKHINHIFSKLDVPTRAQAIVRAQRLNMLP
jgi:ATP/maltotriose-dependent transcriptional regulator MalT